MTNTTNTLPADPLRDPRLEGLWHNCSDSFVHALVHFAALCSEDDSFHNRKWAVLSVYHAAEVFGNFLLSSLDPSHPVQERFGEPYYPSLRALVTLLRNHMRWKDLSRGERRLFEEFLPPICDIRDQLMHRVADEHVDVSPCAIALLGLLHVVRRRTGVKTRDLYDQSPPVEADLLDAVDYRLLDRYNGLVEELVGEYYPPGLVDHCPFCGAHARMFGVDCEACFSEEAWRMNQP
jgi:hypothetical protein